jgi:hypothetical protein
VCKYLRNSTERPYVWRTAVCIIGNDQFQTSRDKSGNGLLRVNDYSCYLLKKYLRYVEKVCTGLFCDLGYVCVRSLFPTLGNLKYLNIAKSWEIRDDSIAIIVNHCPKLLEMDLSHCSGLTSKSLFLIAQKLNLKKLNVTATRCVTNKSWLVLCAMNDSIESLSMASCFMIRWDILAGIFMPSLKYWDLSKNNLLSFSFLQQVVKSRAVLKPSSIMHIKISDCEDISLEQVQELEAVEDANIELVSNPKLRNHREDGIREYLLSITNS